MSHSIIRRIAVLGSTGSVGQQVLDVVDSFPERFRIVGLAGGNNTALLAKQIGKFRPKLAYSPHKLNLPKSTKFSAMDEIAAHPEIDLVVIATSSKIGLAPTLAAIRSRKRIALANKEVLVMAGEIIMTEAKRNKVKIMPVDSEHSAIWQCLRGETAAAARLILTASGGPFYGYQPGQLEKVTVEDALQHPTWKMGRKITIDSATLLNKGLEMIEAHWLFSIPLAKIETVFHPQSIVHSLVEFIDGSMKAQLNVPDMRFPIQYALSYPKRLFNPKLPYLNLSQVNLQFEPIDYPTYPCLKLALDAGEKGGTCPAVLCGANDVAVELFLSRRIRFIDIPKIVDKTLSSHQVIANPAIDDILAADVWARKTALRLATRNDSEWKQ